MLPIEVTVDGEKAVIDFLIPLLEADPLGAEAECDRRKGASDKFVQVRRIGGGPGAPSHDRPRLDILVWYDDDKSRMELARTIWAWLQAAAGERVGTAPEQAVLYYLSTMLGPRQMPDPADDTKTIVMLTVEMKTRPAS